MTAEEHFAEANRLLDIVHLLLEIVAEHNTRGIALERESNER